MIWLIIGCVLLAILIVFVVICAIIASDEVYEYDEYGEEVPPAGMGGVA